MNDSIKEIRQKIKRFGHLVESKDIFMVMVIILVAFASFGLGRMSKMGDGRIPVKIEHQASLLQAKNTSNSAQNGENQGLLPANDKMYVASKNGSKYHFPWCSGAKRMKESNKIWFATAGEARAAGYGPAGNCKGLD